MVWDIVNFSSNIDLKFEVPQLLNCSAFAHIVEKVCEEPVPAVGVVQVAGVPRVREHLSTSFVISFTN